MSIRDFAAHRAAAQGCAALALLAMALTVVPPSALAQGAAPVAAAPAAPAPVKLAPALQRIRETGVVLIGARPEASPFSFTFGNRPVGYAIDICNEVVENMRRDFKRPLQIEYVPVSAQNRFDLVKGGKAHFECGATINDPARRKAGAVYSMPYFFSGPLIMTRTNSGIRDFYNLAGKRVVVIKGTNSVTMLRKRLEAGTLPGMALTEVANRAEAGQALREGKADAVVWLDVLNYGLRTEFDNPAEFHVVGIYQLLEPIAAILPPGDPEMKQYFDRQLAALMLNGTVARLYNKWFLAPIPPSNRVLDMPLNPVLRDQFRWPTDRLGDEVH